MAKMGEGEFYYYLPVDYDARQSIERETLISKFIAGEWHCIIRRDAPHPNFTVIVEQVSQDNASLIVDALNYFRKSVTDELEATERGG